MPAELRESTRTLRRPRPSRRAGPLTHFVLTSQQSRGPSGALGEPPAGPQGRSKRKEWAGQGQRPGTRTNYSSPLGLAAHPPRPMGNRATSQAHADLRPRGPRSLHPFEKTKEIPFLPPPAPNAKPRGKAEENPLPYTRETPAYRLPSSEGEVLPQQQAQLRPGGHVGSAGSASTGRVARGPGEAAAAAGH